jgi:hypothetical protein
MEMVVLAGASPDKVTVQAAVPPEVSTVGVHDSELSVSCEFSVIAAVRETPFSSAVTVAWPSVVTVPAAAVNVAAV